MEITIKVTGKLVIEKIDRKTNNVVEKKEIENALTTTGAYQIRQLAYLVDTAACTDAFRPNKLALLDTNKQLIKEIPGGTFTTSDTGTAQTITWSWTDSSTDSYTVYYAGIERSGDTYSNTLNPNQQLLHATSVSPAFTKNSSDTVKYTWTINIQYSAI